MSALRHLTWRTPREISEQVVCAFAHTSRLRAASVDACASCCNEVLPFLLSQMRKALPARDGRLTVRLLPHYWILSIKDQCNVLFPRKTDGPWVEFRV